MKAKKGLPSFLVVAAAMVAALLLVRGAGSAGGTTERVSVDSAGGEANDESYSNSISADGRYVAFWSRASNLVPNDNNGLIDVFVHDRVTGATELVSLASDGTQGNNRSYDPVISADGRYVAFWSYASNFVAIDANGSNPDVFVHDRVAGTTELVSLASDGTQGNNDSWEPDISADGRYVAFWSLAANLIPGGNALWDVYIRDRLTGTTESVSVASDGTPGNSHSHRPSISADGRFVAFISEATNLAEGADGSADVFVHDRETGSTEHVGDSIPSIYGLDISADGRYVAWTTGAACNETDANAARDICLLDRLDGITTLSSVASDGSQGNHDSEWPSISADGRYVAFWSQASNLVPDDNNNYCYLSSNCADVFVHDHQTGATEIVSVDSTGNQGNNASYDPAMDLDGRYVAFGSIASNLVPDDNNLSSDVFVHDRCPDGSCGGGPTPTPSPSPTPTPEPPACGQKMVVFIRGIAFTWADDAYLTKPASEWGDGFIDIAGYLKSEYGYGDDDFRWFNYSSDWDEGDYDPATQDNGEYNGADTRQSLFQSALSLENQIKYWASLCPESRLDVITHSLGGAVAAYWAGFPFDSVEKVHTVLTLESPLGGVPGALCVAGIITELIDMGGDAAFDLCQSSVKETMKQGLNAVAFLAVNNRRDPIVNGCIAQGISKADGAVNRTLDGRVWDSYDFGRWLMPETCLGNVIGEAKLGHGEHSAPLESSCKCWPHLLPKLAGATLHDDRSSEISYSGDWQQHANSARVMGTDSVSSEPGATLTFDAPGQPSKVIWITMKGPSAGKATVSVCGGKDRNVNLRRGVFDARREFEFDVPNTCSGPELRITVPSWRFGLGRDVNVDAFEIWE